MIAPTPTPTPTLALLIPLALTLIQVRLCRSERVAAGSGRSPRSRSSAHAHARALNPALSTCVRSLSSAPSHSRCTPTHTLTLAFTLTPAHTLPLTPAFSLALALTCYTRTLKAPIPTPLLLSIVNNCVRANANTHTRAPNPARAHAHSGAAVTFRARGCWRTSKPAQIYTLSVMEATDRQPRHHALTLKRTLTKRRSISRSRARLRVSSK